ncbi:MAG: hypothetical protein AAF517_05080, partial [Planctomycetota bacterium]
MTESSEKNIEFSEHALPGDTGTVDLPADLDVKMENESTLLAQPKGCEHVALRVSSLSFTTKSGDFVA